MALHHICILAFSPVVTVDHTRVVLYAPDKDGSDYINASFIDVSLLKWIINFSLLHFLFSFNLNYVLFYRVIAGQRHTYHPRDPLQKQFQISGR